MSGLELVLSRVLSAHCAAYNNAYVYIVAFTPGMHGHKWNFSQSNIM